MTIFLYYYEETGPLFVQVKSRLNVSITMSCNQIPWIFMEMIIFSTKVRSSIEFLHRTTLFILIIKSAIRRSNNWKIEGWTEWEKESRRILRRNGSFRWKITLKLFSNSMNVASTRLIEKLNLFSVVFGIPKFWGQCTEFYNSSNFKSKR